MKQKDLYFFKRWGEGYFDVSPEGNILVKPGRTKKSGDLYKLVQTLVAQGIEPPILIRFNEILKSSIHSIHKAFSNAIKEYSYRSHHCMAYPIKVNPQRSVVECVEKYGRQFKMGLEVGSKPELIAVLTLDNHPESLLLCNGYKDSEYISLALMARKLGKRAIIIIEQPYELKLVLEMAQKFTVEPEIGFRMKISSPGAGRWQSSSGDHAKFGLFTYEIVECMQTLKAQGKEHWLKLLHFHIGSQQTTIESIKSALNEASMMYTEIAKGNPSLAFFDVGGGLAVDYDGTRSQNDSSMNYTIEEYARNVVSVIGEACLQANVEDPVIITESGRAIVSRHSVLIVEVIDVTSSTDLSVNSEIACSHPILETLVTSLNEVSFENCREIFHDCQELKDKILTEFVGGQLTLEERALAEKVYRLLLMKIHDLCKQKGEIPEEMEFLERFLLETYFCNFSVFQSLPDSWAINQLFPIMPIHRLHETPGHCGVLADLTCDSDGKIDTFIGKKMPANFLNLHKYQEGPYYIGIFLVGAYQEILGGLHNLFGDTNVVHAELGTSGTWKLSKLVEGDTVEEVLHYAQYNTEKQMEQLHLKVEESVKAGRLTHVESAQVKKKFKQALESYTYLIT